MFLHIVSLMVALGLIVALGIVIWNDRRSQRERQQILEEVRALRGRTA